MSETEQAVPIPGALDAEALPAEPSDTTLVVLPDSQARFCTMVLERRDQDFKDADQRCQVDLSKLLKDCNVPAGAKFRIAVLPDGRMAVEYVNPARTLQLVKSE